jgi:integrase
LLAYYTGARLSDCCAMPWDAVDFAAGTLTYTPQKTGGEPVMIPMHPELHAHLESLATSDKPERFVMPHMSGLKSGGRHGLSESFKNLMRKTGVDSQRVERDVGVRTLSRRSFHSLRHSFTSALANADVPPELRMKLTGHTTEATHKIYTHHEIETLRRAIEKLPGLQG